MQHDFTFDTSETLDQSQANNRYANDNKLHTTFYTRPVLNAVKSEKAGRPIYDEVDYVKIFTPGSQLSVIDAPMTAGTYLTRFKDRYEKWKSGQAQLISGTPVESFPFLLGKVGLVAELKAMNIHTVEQLAAIADNHLQNLMGGQELRRKAAEYLEGTSGTGAEIAKLQEQNAELKKQMDNMMAMFGNPVKPETAQPEQASKAIKK